MLNFTFNYISTDMLARSLCVSWASCPIRKRSFRVRDTIFGGFCDYNQGCQWRIFPFPSHSFLPPYPAPLPSTPLEVRPLNPATGSEELCKPPPRQWARAEPVRQTLFIAFWAGNRGGATVLKVGGTNSASEASRKYFLTPHFLAIWGQNIA